MTTSMLLQAFHAHKINVAGNVTLFLHWRFLGECKGRDLAGQTQSFTFWGADKQFNRNTKYEDYGHANTAFVAR